MTEIFGNNMNYLRRSLLYDSVSQNQNDHDHDNSWSGYPALRPNSYLAGVQPRKDTVLVKTGGNALQALDRTAFEQPDVMAVTVPCNTTAGDEMLVRLPQQDRLIKTVVPEGMYPGHVFLMRVPPPPPSNKSWQQQQQSDVDGHDLQLEEVPMNSGVTTNASTTNYSIVSGGGGTTTSTSGGDSDSRSTSTNTNTNTTLTSAATLYLG